MNTENVSKMLGAISGIHPILSIFTVGILAPVTEFKKLSFDDFMRYNVLSSTLTWASVSLWNMKNKKWTDFMNVKFVGDGLTHVEVTNNSVKRIYHSYNRISRTAGIGMTLIIGLFCWTEPKTKK